MVQIRNVAELLGDPTLRHLPTRAAARRVLKESVPWLGSRWEPTRRSIQRGRLGWEVYVRREVTD